MVLSDIHPARPSPQLWGANSQPSPGQTSTIGTFQVSYSGQSILYSPADSEGNLLTVSSLRNTDDVQILSLIGVPTSTTLTLQLGQATTAPIPLQPAPPLTSFVWSATVPQAGSYDLWLAWGNSVDINKPHACTHALVEVFDATTSVGSVVLDQTVFPDPSTDLGINEVGVFKFLGTFSLASTKLQVRLSGSAASGILLAGNVRVVPHGVTDLDKVGYIDSTPGAAYAGNLAGQVSFTTNGNWTVDFYYTPTGGWHGFWYATATGTKPTAVPTASAIQTALQGLPNVPNGSVTVSSITNQSFSIHFVGVLSGDAQPTMLPSDPAFQITHDDTGGSSVGGQFPTVQINNATYPLRAASYASGQPTVLFHLVQDLPSIQYTRCGEATFTAGYVNVEIGAGFSGRTAMPSQLGEVGSCRFDGLPGPADYQLDLTWPSGDLQADGLQCVIQDLAGNTVKTTGTIDQSQPPADFREAGVGWKTLGQFHCAGQLNSLVVRFEHPTSSGKHCLLDAIRLQRLSPNQGTQIRPTDTVLFSAPDGFVTTNNGPMPAANLLRVAPAPAYRLPPPGPGRKTMKIGTNCDYPTYYGTDSCFANIAIQALTPIGLAQGADGCPTKLGFDSSINMGSTTTPMTGPAPDGRGFGLGAPNSANGIWVVQWTSATGCACKLLSAGGATTVIEDVGRRVVGPTYRSYYQVQDNFFNAPSVRLAFTSPNKNPDGTYACDVHNVAVYPPDVNPDNPGRWRPGFLSKLQQFDCLRFMDLFGTNFLSLAHASQFPQSQNFPLGYAGRSLSVPIAKIGPPTPDPFCDSGSGFVVRVTTTVPHGLVNGFFVGLRTTDNSSLGQVVGNAIDPKTGSTTNTPCPPLDPTDRPGQSFVNICHVIDATTIQVTLETYVGPLGRMSNTLTPTNAYLYADVATGALMSPSDAAQLCVDAGLEPWVNVPWLADDDCVTQMAKAFVSKIPIGTQVHVEYGNEAWNYAFNGFGYCTRQGALLYGSVTDYVPWYTTRFSQVHQIFRSVWQQAGRDPSEIRRVCGSQQGNAGGSSSRIIDFAVSHGITFDEVSPATYFSNSPLQGSYDDLLTREQLLDLMAVNVRLSETTAAMLDQRNALTTKLIQYPQQTWLSTVEIVNYEGGPDQMTTGTMSANLNRLNHAVSRDPDFYQIMLYQLQTLQDAGVGLFNIFTLYGARDVDQWGVYEGFQQAPGTGSVTLDPANRSDFENLLQVKSEKGGALKQWHTLMYAPLPGPVSLRNGTALAFGQPSY